MTNLQSGLFLIGTGALVLLGFWSGAFALVGEELVALIRGDAASGALPTAGAGPAPAGASA